MNNLTGEGIFACEQKGEPAEMTSPSAQPFDDYLLSTAANIIRSRLSPQESLEDVLRGTAHLAIKRAELFNRSATSLDFLYILYIFYLCAWMPTPPRNFEEQLPAIRQDIFTGASRGYFERLDAAVPNATLLLSFDALDKLQALGDVKEFLRVPDNVA